jgi:hypothetical protein
MKKVLLTLLAMILVIGVLAGAGFAGYRIGYTRGVQASANGDAPLFGRFERFGPERIPMPNFGSDSDRGFDSGFPHRGFQMMQRGRGFGMFSPLMFLAHLAIWALVVGLVYLLFTRSGLRLSLTKQPVQNPPTNIETELKPQDQNSENE